jgi:hypothetical protein
MTVIDSNLLGSVCTKDCEESEMLCRLEQECLRRLLKRAWYDLLKSTYDGCTAER